MEKTRILIVEDDVNQRALYEEEFRDRGYEVDSASDGRDALLKMEASQKRYDCVVMDVSMPGMDGIEAMSRMLAKNHKLPIVLHTAYPSYKDNFRALSADGFVVKSSDLTNLFDTVEEVLDSRERERVRV